jgi:hypothetical protein
MPDEIFDMFPELFALIVFFFLLVGAAVFLVCFLLPPTRRYALSAALWCACWGPAALGWMMIAGLALVTEDFITRSGDTQSLHLPKLPVELGWSYLILAAVATAAFATAVAWLHQVLVRRTTFALFRLYATAVSAGIGSVFGLFLGWWIVSTEIPHGWLWSLLCTLLLVAGFGIVAYKCARQLRGEAPTRFTWISPEEYAGL